MLVGLCIGFAVGVVGTLALVDVHSHEQIYKDLKMCMRQFDAIERYFSQCDQGELKVFGTKGFLTFMNGECIGYRLYSNI